jgi:hypothetical protein
MHVVSRFLEDAESLFQTASASSPGAAELTDLAIAVGPGGAIRITQASGWDLAAWQAHCGARSAYRVSRNAHSVRVEGRSGSQSCLLRTEPPALTAHRLLNSIPCARLAAGEQLARLEFGIEAPRAYR